MLAVGIFADVDLLPASDVYFTQFDNTPQANNTVQACLLTEKH